jgi:glycosyltransferase involved in cell wall biosynthesis
MGAKSGLKVGIYFNARVEQGGLYQYALTLVDCLYRYVPDNDYFLYHATLEELPLQLQAANWHIIELPKEAIASHMVLELLLNKMAQVGLKSPLRLIPQFRQIAIDPPDLMIYVKPTPHVFEWPYPAIFPIHDLQHRLQPEFPEVSNHGEFLRREFLYNNAIAKANGILVDSQTGKEDVLHLYTAKESIIFPLPYIAPSFRALKGKTFEQVKARYALPDSYFFYPAAFWSHKNHARLIRALKQVEKEHGVGLQVVLSGRKQREYKKLQTLVEELQLQEKVHFIGFVEEEDLLFLYQHALALVMPTFFGPTNIPVLEAWAAGCPVITSDIRGIREQVSDAGLLVDPEDVTALANAMWTLSQSQEKRAVLIAKGRTRVNSWMPENFGQRLGEIIKIVGLSNR